MLSQASVLQKLSGRICREVVATSAAEPVSLDCSWQSEEGQDPRQFSLLGRRVLSLFLTRLDCFVPG